MHKYVQNDRYSGKMAYSGYLTSFSGDVFYCVSTFLITINGSNIIYLSYWTSTTVIWYTMYTDSWRKGLGSTGCWSSCPVSKKRTAQEMEIYLLMTKETYSTTRRNWEKGERERINKQTKTGHEKLLPYVKLKKDHSKFISNSGNRTCS